MSWDVMFSNACLTSSSFTTILELHEVSWYAYVKGCVPQKLSTIVKVADIQNFQLWSKMLPSDNLPLTNGSTVIFLLRVDTPREGYSVSRECNGKINSY